MKELVFIHGRSQHGKDSISLKQEWIDAWAEGLEKSGLKVPIPPSKIRFPYYGDTLDQLVNGADDREQAEVVVRGLDLDEEEKRFIQDYVEELQEKRASIGAPLPMPLPDAEIRERGVLNWPWVQQLLRGLDEVPMAGTVIIALFTNDVFKYLHSTSVRDKIDEGVRQAFSSDVDTVLVGHSLGTVIAYNILHQYGPGALWRVPLLVTLGSPLGVNAINKRLKPPRVHPACVRNWFNALDPRDGVALWPLSLDRLDPTIPPVENKTDVDNFTDNRHGIAGYLSDRDVALRVYQALV